MIKGLELFYECGPKGFQDRKFMIRMLFVFESRRLETSDVHFKVYKVTRNITFITRLSILVDLSDWGGREEEGRKVVMLLEEANN